MIFCHLKLSHPSLAAEGEGQIREWPGKATNFSRNEEFCNVESTCDSQCTLYTAQQSQFAFYVVDQLISSNARFPLQESGGLCGALIKIFPLLFESLILEFFRQVDAFRPLKFRGEIYRLKSSLKRVSSLLQISGDFPSHFSSLFQ